MKYSTVVLAFALALSPQFSVAKVIKSACIKADRGSRAQCGCIQSVANQTLSNRQQRKGAKFFADPQKAQDIRQSSRKSDNEMWEAWKNFGALAEERCS